MLESFLSWMLANPGTVMISSIVVATAVVFLDFKKEKMFSVPGMGRMGLAGVLLVAASLFYFYATYGISGMLDQVASGIFYVVVIGGVFSAFYFGTDD